MTTSMVYAGKPPFSTPLPSQDATAKRVVKEVEAFKQMPPLSMVKDDLPLLAPLALRVLAIPARRPSRNDYSRALD